MMNLSDPLSLLYFLSTLIFFVLVAFIALISIIYNRNQRQLLLEIKVEKEKRKNDQLKNEMEAQRQLFLERDRISRDLHDDLGAGISAVSLELDLISRSKGLAAEAQGSLEQLVGKTRDIAGSLKELIWSLDEENKDLKSVFFYFKSYTFNLVDKYELKLQWRQELLPETHEVVMRHLAKRNLFLILKESLNNVLKHSQATEVKVLMSYANNKLVLEVEDNGVGLSDKKVSKGNGLTNMRKRAAQLGGYFDISNYHQGTMLKVVVPGDKALMLEIGEV